MSEHLHHIPEITRDQLVQKRHGGEPFILVDVLTHEHFLRAHLPGAINVPVDRIRELAPLLFGEDDEIVVYCANPKCSASATAANILTQLGFTNIWEFSGGIQEWIDGNLPLVVSDDLLLEIERRQKAA